MSAAWGEPDTRKSRRLRDCDWCVQPIQKGEQYVHWWGLNEDREIAMADVHPECMEAVMREGVEDACWGEAHARGLTSEETDEARLDLQDLCAWLAGVDLSLAGAEA